LQLYNCIADLKCQSVQLDLYKKEIQHISQNNNYGSNIFATLFIYKQPFPLTIKQFSKAGPIDVILLLGAKTQANPIGPVVAELLNDWTVVQTKKRQSPLKNTEEIINKTNNIARFSKLTFLVGTGCKAVQLKFTSRVEILNLDPNYESEVTIESIIPSENFIVMTNTKQWSEAQGILLKKDMFKGKLDITRNQFCNCLQRHYIDASKQSPDSPTRTLGRSEFLFLFQKN